MATIEEIAALRRMVDEPTEATYTDNALSAYIDNEGSLNGAATVVWQEKAAQSTNLVNVSESGSSRSMQQVHQNALAMAKYYGGLSTSESAIILDESQPFTSDIERN